ncbi:MAG: hypothetical protein V4581_04150 [Bacteroidota bacterium]
MKILLQIFSFLLFTNFAFAQNDNVDTEYQLHHDELKILYIQKIHSESYALMNKVHDAYRAKANYEKNKNKVRDINKFGAWVRTHLSETNFKTIKEADEEWEKFIKSTQNEMTVNYKYSNYLDVVLGKPYGPTLVARVHTEVMSEYPEIFGLSKEKADKLKEMLKKQQE